MTLSTSCRTSLTIVASTLLLCACGLRGELVNPPGPPPEPVLGWPGGIRPGTQAPAPNTLINRTPFAPQTPTTGDVNTPIFRPSVTSE